LTVPAEKILLVDDDPHILATLGRFLNSQGYAVAAAARGLEALETLRRDSIPAALVDVNLPDISGLELLAHIREHSPDTMVILFTGLGGLDSAIQALRLGAYDYLVKSELRLPELQSVLERALERRRLALANRQLLEDLRRAREELAATRARELAQIRRIGETLARPLQAPEVVAGLLDLIWESLPLEMLGLVFRRAGEAEALRDFRQQPDCSPEALPRFQSWLSQELDRASGRLRDPAEGAWASEPPAPAVLQEFLHLENASGLVAGCRQTPFTLEETEIFRIVSLQGEAAFRNLLLFEEVKSLAVRDGLTGLYNYRYFREMLAHQVEMSRRYGRPLSLLFADIDDFKKVNDTLGHPVGDLVLQTLAGFLETHLRHSDVLCRYGGEEFVVLLPHTDTDQARHIAERLRQGISRLPIPAPSGDLFITISIGLATLTGGMKGEDLVQTADQALLSAKRTGKNRVCGPEEIAG
jgi:diguanylate cyclase (GGDEF)-like protein